MPFTPYHMGFGLIAKSAKPAKVSLIMFGFSQIVIDLQQLYKHIMSPHGFAYHGLTHTIIGATLVAIICLPCRGLLERIFRLTISKPSAIYGVLIGVYSHLLLDSLVHSEVSQQLFWPFHIDSHLYGFIYLHGMNKLCIIMGIIGLILLWQKGEIQAYFTPKK